MHFQTINFYSEISARKEDHGGEEFGSFASREEIAGVGQTTR